MSDTVNIDFDLPMSEYAFLTLICECKNVMLKDFIVQTLMQAIEQAENEIFAEKAKEPFYIPSSEAIAS